MGNPLKKLSSGFSNFGSFVSHTASNFTSSVGSAVSNVGKTVSSAASNVGKVGDKIVDKINDIAPSGVRDLVKKGQEIVVDSAKSVKRAGESVGTNLGNFAAAGGVEAVIEGAVTGFASGGIVGGVIGGLTGVAKGTGAAAVASAQHKAEKEALWNEAVQRAQLNAATERQNQQQIDYQKAVTESTNAAYAGEIQLMKEAAAIEQQKQLVAVSAGGGVSSRNEAPSRVIKNVVQSVSIRAEYDIVTNNYWRI